MGWDPYNQYGDPKLHQGGNDDIFHRVGHAVKGAWDTITGDPGAAAEAARKKLLYDQANKAGGFADLGQAGFGGLGVEADAARQNLADQASGKLSYSREALRQGLAQNVAAQRSMAAGASPQNSAMAARTAAMQSARLGSGMSGQASLAGIQEQMAAAKAYQDAILQQRQQELQAALQSRSNAMSGYGAGNAGAPEKSWMEKYAQPVIGGLDAYMKGGK